MGCSRRVAARYSFCGALLSVPMSVLPVVLRSCLLCWSALLASCGGGGTESALATPPESSSAVAPHYQYRALVNQTEAVIQDSRFNVDFLSVPPWVPDDPAISV